MKINYDKSKIEAALDDFTRATGINIQLLQSDFSVFHIPSTKYTTMNNFCAEIQSAKFGCRACKESDRQILERCRESQKPEMHICHAGLMDVAVPLIFENTLIGYLILGQMKTDQPFDAIKNHIAHLPINLDKMEMLYENLTVFDPHRIKSVERIAEMLARYLLLEDTIQPHFNSNIQKAIQFINQNLSQNLSVDCIIKHSNISKNTLYRTFKKEYGVTVNQYITMKRIEEAQRLLRYTDMSVEEISERVGFSSSPYFSAVFKKANGISPLTYRKTQV